MEIYDFQKSTISKNPTLDKHYLENYTSEFLQTFFMNTP